MKKIKQLEVFNNGFFQILQTFWKKDNGNEGNVMTMKDSSGKDSNGVYIFALTPEKEIVYIKEFKFGPETYMEVLPAGGCQDNNWVEHANRELLEETGYKAEKYVLLGEFNNHNYISGRIGICLGYNCIKLHEQEIENLEDITVYKTAIRDFEEKLKDGTIYCPWTHLAFRLAKEKTNNFTNFDF